MQLICGNPVQQALNSSSVDSEVRSDAFFSCMYMSMKGLGGQIMDYPNYN